MSGVAFSFVDSEQVKLVKFIERLIGKQIAVIEGHRYDEKLLAKTKPASDQNGELTGEDFRRQKRANQLNLAAERRGAPEGRPQRSTYSRTRGEVRSRPSNAIYATAQNSFISEGAYQKRSPKKRSHYTDRDDYAAFDAPKRKETYQEPVRKESAPSTFVKPAARKSFNPNFNNNSQNARPANSRRRR